MHGYLRVARPRRPGAADLAVALAVFALLYALVHLGAGWGQSLRAAEPAAISLSPTHLPYYAGRSMLRMAAAFLASVAFSLIYGYLAARSSAAERVLIPLLDVLQSVPVLGFLSVSLTTFMALFPGSMVGLELASIFAIFTSQVWNLTFAFYHALSTVPQELWLVSALFGLSPWQRFRRLELPYAMVPLVWNGMMSFGGGWFFLAASEAVSVLNRRLMLPGLGSYLAVALDRADSRAVLWAIAAMATVILALDQLVWRPLVAWADRFKLEQTAGFAADPPPASAVLILLRRSVLVSGVEAAAGTAWSWAAQRVGSRVVKVRAAAGRLGRVGGNPGVRRLAGRVLARLAVVAAVAWVLQFAWLGARLVAQLGMRQIVEVASLGVLTLARVVAAVLLGALWTVPLGVAIGLNPRLAAQAQALVQLAAAFPANMLFPFVAYLYLRWRVDFQVGSVVLMMLGTQWYLLFNVIAGARALPAELREAAATLRLRGWPRWRRVLLPAVFPALVTGGLTAAGGAWNASIVAEVTWWGTTRLRATGLGAYITDVAARGQVAGLVWGIMVMAVLVVLFNRLVWRRLYHLAETRLGGPP